MNLKQVEELLLQSLEHEQGGVKVYSTAVRCAQNPDLKEEWHEYLEQTKTHVTALESACRALGIDAGKETPGRQVVRHVGGALVEAMNMALQHGDLAAAELVACECVVLAETKDHADWQLLGKCAENLGPEAEALRDAYSTIEDQEDEHLYHSKGWCRELWVQSLGLPAVMPPPEERQAVKTAMGAARAEQASEKARRQMPT
jgi:ferritin-like metal-binding protein YciE